MKKAQREKRTYRNDGPDKELTLNADELETWKRIWDSKKITYRIKELPGGLFRTITNEVPSDYYEEASMVSFRMLRKDYLRLKEVAKANNKSVAQLMRELSEEWLEHHT